MRKNLFLVLFFMLIIFKPVITFAGITGNKWNAADMLPAESGISVLRYGALGLGAYPYAGSLPGADFRIFLDGVPLRSYSPFGPDLELIPTQNVDSFVCDNTRRLNLSTQDVTESVPETSTRFLLGNRRRYNVDMSFSRMIGEKAGLFVSGSSGGIHATDVTEKSSFRNYYIKYRRYLENNSSILFSVRALRDRDGLVDLDSRSHMGERKTDELTSSLGINDYPVTDNTMFASTLYYSDSNSRFDRNSFRKSLDDNTAGFNLSLLTQRGNTSWGLHASETSMFFDSRIHQEKWKRHEGSISASFNHETENRKFKMSGGFINSSEYGGGIELEGEFAAGLFGQDIVIHGGVKDEFPDTGQEYYTSLIFSNTPVVSDLDTYRVSELETGVRFRHERYNLGIFLFGSSSELPFFIPSSGVKSYSGIPVPSHCSMSPAQRFFGCRFYFDTQVERNSTVIDIGINGSSRLQKNNGSAHINWPYPSTELFTDVNVSRSFLNDRLKSTAFGSAGFLRWNDGETDPQGNHFLLDCGISIQVSSLELFFRIDNVTGQDITWFNTMGWVGRNSMWGVSWIFYD